MNAKEMMEKSRTQVVINERFFATVLMNLPAKEDASCETLWTDGTQIGYNPLFIAELTEPKLLGSNIHGIFHVINRHHLRRCERDPKLWNKACDYSINPTIVNMGFELPEEALIEQEYIGKTPEEIYPMLVKKQNQKKEEKKDGGQTNNESGSVGTDGSAGEKKEGKSDSGRKGDSKGKDESEEPEQNGQGEPEEESGVGNDPGGCGEIRDMKNEDGSAMSEAELSNAEAAVKIMIASAANIAEKAGVGYSEALKKLIGELKAPERNWREDLLEYFQQYAKNDYTWSSPSRRHVPFGLYLPSMRSQEIGQVVLVGDSSGSTTNLWEPFMSEMKSLMEMFNLKLTVIIADNQIQETREEVESEEILTIQPSGFGGTDFRPAFDWVEIMGIEPALLIYFTDLDCRLFPKEPDYPVVWASWKYENAPFGKVIKVK